MPPRVRPSIINPETGTNFFDQQEVVGSPTDWNLFPQRLLCGATEHMDLNYFRKACTDLALEELPEYLASLCLDQKQGFERKSRLRRRDDAWYFDDVVGALFEFIELRAEKIKRGLVMTVVAKQVFRVLGIASRTKLMILLRGGSRFGKTECLEAYCQMWPGRARLVTVPESNGIRDFLHAIATAIGIDARYGTNPRLLRGLIADVMKLSGLFLVFDEGHFLIPRSYTERTSPDRLNWVRAQLFDWGWPVVVAGHDAMV
jgi:hypothetical protein